MQSLNVAAALPEIALLVAASIVLLADVLVGSQRRIDVDRLALGALLFPLIASVWQVGTEYETAFGGMYVADSLSHLLKFCSYAAVAASIVYARSYTRDRDMFRGEFYCLALFSLLGQMIMISANNLLVVYLGLELMSLSLYALAALRRDHPLSSEAAIKYFVLGALSSGFLLYGMSMIYGGTGSLDIPEIAKALAAAGTDRGVMVFGVVFLVAGLAFKFGAVPFHMWLPDVYHGTPTAATLLIAGAPKLAAFAIAFRLLAEALLGVAGDWQPMLMMLAVLSLLVGNLVAIAQTNFKRMLAYSTISQVGFVLLGMMSGVIDGNARSAADAYGASLFYVITYVLTTLGTFGLVQVLARKGFECEEIDDLRGLGQRSPWMALVMLILMFSLAGIPPTVGFYAKLAVLQSALAAGHLWLVIFAVMMSLVGAFYYIRIVKTMFFDEAVDRSAIVVGQDAQATLALNGALVLLLGVMPGPLLTACSTAIRHALSF